MHALIISNKIRKIPGGAVETIVNPLKKRGYEVTWAANFQTAKFDLSLFPCNILNTYSETNPISKNSFRTRKIISSYLNTHNVDLIFCSTPVGGINGRLCGKKANISKIIYQAHGFLFFNGGPKLGFFYKAIEKFLAKYTDVLITINKEDYCNAKKFKLRNDSKNVYMVNGSGEDYSSLSLSSEEKSKLKTSLNISDKDFVFISIGELNKNKNVLASVKAFKKSFFNTRNVKFLICGEGNQSYKIKKYIDKFGLDENIKLLGYRTDIKQLLKISNCYISSSLREGLSRTVGEAMAASLPCIVSNKRGLKDWMEGHNDFMFNPKSIDDIARVMSSMVNNKDLESVGQRNLIRVLDYSSTKVVSQMESIFDKVL